MNKYHKHQSRGINGSKQRTVVKTRCPVTAKLVDSSNSVRQVTDADGKRLKLDAKSNSAKTIITHSVKVEVGLSDYEQS